ncbi:MAG: CPBP family intramembrane glutamic endopeptidase [Candidatus Zixiibacteriota bacterium]
MEKQSFERIPAYEYQAPPDLNNPFIRFKLDSGNETFQHNFLTFITLFVLIIVYPGISLIGVGEDPAALFKSLNEATLMFLLITTVLMQWIIFLLNFVAVYTEKTGLGGLMLARIRMLDFAWAVAFVLAANLILSGLAWFLARIGIPMHGEISMLVPTETAGRILWVAVAFTAGFCEEVAFRGYLMTRLRLLGKFKNWIIPTLISAVIFGTCHAYQGLPGFIVITAYGLMFSLLYIRTGRLWPCIIAHFFQDFSALFIPQ